MDAMQQATQAFLPPADMDEKITVLLNGYAIEMTRREIMLKRAVMPPNMDSISAMLALAQEGIMQYNDLKKPVPATVRRGQTVNKRDIEGPQPLRARIMLGENV